MDQQPNKYHISDDGKVYRVNEDGSFTSMGNVENIGMSEKSDPLRFSINDKSVSKKQKTPHRSKKTIFIFLLIIGLFIFGCGLYFISNSNQISYTSDSKEIQSYTDTCAHVMDEGIQQKKVIENLDISKTAETTSNFKAEEIKQDIRPTESNKEEESQIYDYVPPRAYGPMEGENNFFLLFPDERRNLCTAHKQRITTMLNNLGDYSDYTFEVDGYLCTYTGTYNAIREDLHQRVLNVIEYLMGKGIRKDQIKANFNEIPEICYGPYGHVSIIVTNINNPD